MKPTMNPAEEELTALRRVIRATDIHSRHLEKTVGLTAPQLLLLQILRQRGQVTIGTLAREMNLSQATVTTVMDRLADRGVVTRVRSESAKRKVVAALTQAGDKLLINAPTLPQQHLDASPVLDIGALDR